MGRVSTTNYKEALETGKEYLSPNFYSVINKIKPNKPVRRCEYCRRVLIESNKNNHCDNLCSSADETFKAMKKRYEKKILQKQRV